MDGVKQAEGSAGNRPSLRTPSCLEREERTLGEQSVLKPLPLQGGPSPPEGGGGDVVPAVRKDRAELRQGRERTSVGVRGIHDGEGGWVCDETPGCF